MTITIMIVDDSPTIRKSAEIFLKGTEYRVVSAEDGYSALAVLRKEKPDVVFADIMMPRMDGYQLCATVKKNREFKDTPLVLLSSKNSPFDMARGRIAGAEEYITKPFNKQQLLEAIQRYIKE